MNTAESYIECARIMVKAAQQWLREHPFAEPLRFTDFENSITSAVHLEGKSVAIAVSLDTVVDLWAANADTRAFLQAMVEATNGEATFMQAKAVVEIIVERTLRKASGKLADGDWRCVECGKQNNGFTNLDGNAAPPGPGDISACGYCGAIQQVNDAGNAYKPLSAREFNQLPKETRKLLLSFKNKLTAHVRKQN